MFMYSFMKCSLYAGFASSIATSACSPMYIPCYSAFAAQHLLRFRRPYGTFKTNRLNLSCACIAMQWAAHGTALPVIFLEWPNQCSNVKQSMQPMINDHADEKDQCLVTQCHSGFKAPGDVNEATRCENKSKHLLSILRTKRTFFYPCWNAVRRWRNWRGRH